MRGLEGRVNTLSYTLADALANPGQQRKTKKIKRKEREATSFSSSSAEKPPQSKFRMSAGEVAAKVLSINNSQAANTENMDARGPTSSGHSDLPVGQSGRLGKQGNQFVRDLCAD